MLSAKSHGSLQRGRCCAAAALPTAARASLKYNRQHVIMNVSSPSIPVDRLTTEEGLPLHGRLRRLLEERGAPIFQASLQDPVYNRVLETQSAVLERLESALGVKPTKGRHTVSTSTEALGARALAAEAEPQSLGVYKSPYASF